VQIAAMTNHTALTVSPRKNAMIAQAIAPATAMMPKMILCLAVIGDRSMIATGGKSFSVRIYVMSPLVSSMRFDSAVGNAMPRFFHR
jgi:hypothetical protein